MENRAVFCIWCFVDADVNKAGGTKGIVPLHAAAQMGNKDVMILLLNQGAKITKKDLDKETALHKAARYNRTECVRHLLQM